MAQYHLFLVGLRRWLDLVSLTVNVLGRSMVRARDETGRGQSHRGKWERLSRGRDRLIRNVWYMSMAGAAMGTFVILDHAARVSARPKVLARDGTALAAPTVATQRPVLRHLSHRCHGSGQFTRASEALSARTFFRVHPPVLRQDLKDTRGTRRGLHAPTDNHG